MTPPRYRSLDLWRGVACLSVVVFHATPYVSPIREGAALAAAQTWGAWLVALTTYGHHGVTLFFVISGYCIIATAVKTRQTYEPTRAYLWRRVRRIYPPYWAALILAGVVLLALESAGQAWLLAEPMPGASWLSIMYSPRDLNVWQWIGNVTLTEYWRPALLWRGGGAFVLGVAWTLCYEEQFYWIVGGLLAATRSVRGLLIGAGVVTLGVAILGLTALPQQFHGLFFDGAWLLFACGIAVYAGIAAEQHLPAALSLLLLASIVPGDALAIGAGFAAVLLMFEPLDAALMRRAPAWLHWCGVRCYSIYLVHFPITKAIAHGLSVLGWTSPSLTLFITIPLSLAGTVLIAAPFHAYCERRWMTAPRRQETVAVGTVAAA